MCGVVAMYTSRKSGLNQSDANELFHLLLLNSVRGSDSTGLAGVDMRYAEQTPDIVKVLGNPYNLQNFEDYFTFNKRIVSDYTLVMGHGRAATQGAVNAVNAHPFKEQHITLIHNGTLSNFKALQKEKGLERIEVDSQLVCYMFATEGVAETVAQLDGAYTFMWYDAREGTFNVLRNYQRPLFYGKYSNSDTLVFASEKETLIWNATRNETPLAEIVEVQPHQMLTWNGLSIEPESKRIEPKKYVPTSTQYRGGDGWLPIVHDRQNFSVQKTDTGGFVIERGERVTVDLVDYMPVTKHGYSRYEVLGEYDNNPFYQFRCTMYNVDERELIDADTITGTISSITYRVANGQSIYTVILTNGVLGKLTKPPVNKDEDYLYIPDASNDSLPAQKISKWRAKDLAKKGCSWCLGGINEDQLMEEPQTFGFWGSEIVCPECTKNSLQPVVQQDGCN
jgi:hypothetical protein